MALSINPATKVILVPKTYLSLISGSVYSLDTNQFRKDVMAILSTQAYAWLTDAFSHNTEVTMSGVTYSRTIEFINGFTIEFENGSYSVSCTGSNHNIADVKVVNSVSLIINNSAGLTAPLEAADVWAEVLNGTDAASALLSNAAADTGLMKTYMALEIGDYVDINATTISTQLSSLSITISEPVIGTKRFTRTA